MPTEAQRKASKKWAEAHRETNIKRISECIQRRYATDEEFRNKKRDTERERQRIKREERKAEAEADAEAHVDENIIIVQERPSPNLPNVRISNNWQSMAFRRFDQNY